MKRYNYHIYPPYIDAYVSSKEPRTIRDIKEILIGHACQWGEQSIGAAILNGDSTPMVGDRNVLCCAAIWNDLKTRSLLAVVRPSGSWYNEIEVIEGEIEDCWDVT